MMNIRFSGLTAIPAKEWHQHQGSIRALPGYQNSEIEDGVGIIRTAPQGDQPLLNFLAQRNIDSLQQKGQPKPGLDSRIAALFRQGDRGFID